MVTWLLVGVIASAAPDARVSDEVTVWGESEIQQALDAVVLELQRLGYDRKVVDKGDRIVMKHQDPWRGNVVLFHDGFMVHRRQGVVVSDPAEGSLGAAGWLLCPIRPTSCFKAGGLVVSERKLDPVRGRTSAAITPLTMTLRDRISDASTARTVAELPDRMERLWLHGEPLMGDAVLPDPAARRGHLVAYWATRTRTPWGELVREAVEAFARAVVQTSEHPFTADEIADAGDRGGRPFPVLPQRPAPMEP